MQQDRAAFSVLFDLDGTLHDDDVAVPILVDAAAAHGYALNADSVVNGERFVPRLQMEFGLDRAGAEIIYATYVRLYRERALHLVRPLDYAPELIVSLRRTGVRLALLTQKLETVADSVLLGLGLREHFDAVFGADSLPHMKPDARAALMALDRIGGRPETAAIVGDTPADMACGRDAGLPVVVGVLGTVSASELRDAGATHVVAGLREVESVLHQQAFPASGSPL